MPPQPPPAPAVPSRGSPAVPDSQAAPAGAPSEEKRTRPSTAFSPLALSFGDSRPETARREAPAKTDAVGGTEPTEPVSEAAWTDAGQAAAQPAGMAEGPEPPARATAGSDDENDRTKQERNQQMATRRRNAR